MRKFFANEFWVIALAIAHFTYPAAVIPILIVYGALAFAGFVFGMQVRRYVRAGRPHPLFR